MNINTRSTTLPFRLLLVGIVMVLVALALPQTATVTHAATANFTCRIPGVGGDQYCSGAWDVFTEESAEVCIQSVTYGTTYPLGVFLRDNASGGILGSAELREGDCATLWTNDPGGFRAVYLTIDARSYGYTLDITGVFRTY